MTLMSRQRFLATTDDALELVELTQPDQQGFRARMDAALQRIDADDGDVAPLLWQLSALAAHYMALASGQGLGHQLRLVRLYAMEQSSKFEESP